MNHDSDISRQFRIDYDLKHYAYFHDNAWERELRRLADGTWLAEFAFNLTFAWRGLSVARGQPTLTVTALRAFAAESISRHRPIARAILAGLEQRLRTDRIVRGSPLTTEGQRYVLSRLREVSHSIDVGSAEPLLSREEGAAWSWLLSNKEFKNSLFHSSYMAYCGVYFQYEAFIVNAMRRLCGSPRLRWSSTPARIKRWLGASVADDCCSAPAVELAGHVRDALVHHAGRITDALRETEDPAWFEDGHIVVTAQRVTELHGDLKRRALVFARAAAAHAGPTNSTDQA